MYISANITSDIDPDQYHEEIVFFPKKFRMFVFDRLLDYSLH